MHITIAALPLARLCRFSISLQRCHLSVLLQWFQLQPCHLPDLLHSFQFTAGPLAKLIAQFSVYSWATCQTLFRWFQFTDFIALVPVYSRATGQTLLHWFQFTAFPLVRLYCIGSGWQS